MITFDPNQFTHGILAAVSGGADSTALLHCLARNCPKPQQLAVAHINHGLRGTESDGDAAFVKKLADEYRLRYFEHRIDWNTAERTLSEEQGRKIRYDFLIATAERIGFRYLAVAHQADDQVETVLHRIVRGTGLAGLSGIAPQRQLTPALTLIRPLLNVRRSEIIGYLQSIDRPYRTDTTNLANDFTRNRIRNIILPMLRTELNANVDDAICRLAQLAVENDTVLSELSDTQLDGIILEHAPTHITCNLDKLRLFSTETQRTLLLQLWKRFGLALREMSFEHWTALIEHLQPGDKKTKNTKSTKSIDLPGGVRCRVADKTKNSTMDAPMQILIIEQSQC
jgi:tRNA(Ile)-lysidine synthase